MFPPIPPWEGIHPLLVHFPIALLIVAPAFLILSLFRSPQTQCFSLAALATMVLGTLGAFVAVVSGEAASALLTQAPQEIKDAVREHERLGELARTVFAILTVVYAALLAAPRFLKKEIPRKADLAVRIAFLLVWCGCLLILVNAAHRGGLLVHQHGVRALIVPY